MTLIDSTFNDTFFSEDEFAVPAEFKLNSSTDSVSITVNFFNEAIDQEYSGGMKTVKVPMVICKSSDVEGANRNSTLTIDSVVYHLTDILPDGTGLTSLLLSKDAL